MHPEVLGLRLALQQRVISQLTLRTNRRFLSRAGYCLDADASLDCFVNEELVFHQASMIYHRCQRRALLKNILRARNAPGVAFLFYQSDLYWVWSSSGDLRITTQPVSTVANLKSPEFAKHGQKGNSSLVE